MTSETSVPSTATPAVRTPNDLFRIVRRTFVRFLAGSVAILAVAFLMTVNHVGHPALAAIVMIAGVIGLFLAKSVKEGGRCPRCSEQLMWRKSTFGTGRLSLGLKQTCPGCRLDLDRPWQAPPPNDTSHRDGTLS